MDRGWLSPYAIFDGETQTYVMKDYRVGSPAPAWTFPNRSGTMALCVVDEDIPASEDHSSGITRNSFVYNDLGTLVSGQEYKALYARYNVKSTTPGNPTAEVTGIEGVAASYIADEALTFRGGYFRTYIDASITATMRTALGLEASARASYAGGTACVAEAGTAFVGARIWMAPYFSAASVGNINNFWALWIYGEHATQRNADAVIRIGDAGGGWTKGIDFASIFSSHVIDFSNVTQAAGDISLIRAGSYASPMDVAGTAQYGMMRLYLSTDDDGSSYNRGVFVCLKTAGTKGIFPVAGLAEVLVQSGAGPNKVQAAQFIAMLQESGAKLATLGGDSTAGMYGAWLKVGAVVGSEASAGSRVAAIWLDNQMNIVVDGEEYAAFITTGGSVPDAVFGFETTSSGWSQLFYFDETAYNKDPISNYSFKVLLDTTQYYLPLSTIAGGMGFSGTFTGHVIDFSNVTQAAGDISLIRAGSYASPMDVAGTAQYGMMRLYLSTDDDGSSYNRGVFVCLKTAGTKGIFPVAGLAEVLAQSGAGPNKVQAAQFIAMLQESGAKLATLGGDSTAGMYGAWLKVGAVVGSEASAGSRVAAVWLDNQMNIVVDGEEYAAFLTCGGSKVDAVFGFETTSSGWTALFSFDETAYDQDPVVSSGCVISDGANVPYLRTLLNGTEYGIPLIAI